jgi:hypothetical protein
MGTETTACVFATILMTRDLSAAAVVVVDVDVEEEEDRHQGTKAYLKSREKMSVDSNINRAVWTLRTAKSFVSPPRMVARKNKERTTLTVADERRVAENLLLVP